MNDQTDTELRQMVEQLSPSQRSYLSMLLAQAPAEATGLSDSASYYIVVVDAVKELGLSLPRSIKGLPTTLRSPASTGVTALAEYATGLIVHTSNKSKAHKMMLMAKILKLIPGYLDAKRIAFSPKTLFQTMKNPGALMHHNFPGYSAELLAIYL